MTKPPRVLRWEKLELEKAVTPPQVTERAHICQHKREAELILIAHRGEGKPPVFNVHTATIPVVRDLS